MTGRRNTGAAEQAMRVAVIAWMAEHRGTDVRVIHELAVGERRLDLAFVYPSDIVGFEIKGPLERLGDDRLERQMREYAFYVPEVWLAVHDSVAGHASVQGYPNLLTIGDDGSVINRSPGKEPMRDELCCSRLIERLWDGEARAIAGRLGLVQVQRLEQIKAYKVRAILARLLSGQEIMREVCRELRSRPLTGLGSDHPHAQTPTKAPPAMPVRYRGVGPKKTAPE